MAHISGTFQHARAGRLQLSFTGTFYQGSHRDAGFPDSTSPGNILIRAFIGPAGASRKYSEPLDRNAPSSLLEVAYPGGNVSWPVGTEEVAHQHPTGGLWSYGMDNLKITLVFRKK